MKFIFLCLIGILISVFTVYSDDQVSLEYNFKLKINNFNFLKYMKGESFFNQ